MSHHDHRYAGQQLARHAAHRRPASRVIDRAAVTLPLRLPLVAGMAVWLLGLTVRSRRRAPDSDRANDRGSFTAETVLVTAILVSIALAAIAALGAKVMAKVSSIDFG